MPDEAQASLYIVGSNRLFRDGLMRGLTSHEIVVAGASPTLEGFVASISKGSEPNLLLVSLGPADNLRPHNIERLRARFSSLKTVLLFTDPTPAELSRWIDTSIAACVQNSISIQALRTVLRLVLLGERIFLADAIPLMLRRAAPGPDEALSLTPDEFRILACLGAGQTNKEIAQSLTMSESRVKTAVRKTLLKRGFTNRTQAAVWATEHSIRL